MLLANTSPTSVTFWFKCFQPFSLVVTDGLYHGFTYIHHTNLLALTRFWLPGGSSSRDYDPRELFSFVTLSDQLFIHDPSVVWWYKRSVHLPGLTDNYSMRPRVARQDATPFAYIFSVFVVINGLLSGSGSFDQSTTLPRVKSHR